MSCYLLEYIGIAFAARSTGSVDCGYALIPSKMRAARDSVVQVHEWQSLERIVVPPGSWIPCHCGRSAVEASPFLSGGVLGGDGVGR